jgi:predicted phage tail protein
MREAISSLNVKFEERRQKTEERRQRDEWMNKSMKESMNELENENLNNMSEAWIEDRSTGAQAEIPNILVLTLSNFQMFKFSNFPNLKS